jgi:hypothetical protein
MVGKQLLPWTEGDDVWGVQNIMSPELGEDVFKQWYGSETMLQVSQALMECKREDMQFGKWSTCIMYIEGVVLICRIIQHFGQPPQEGLCVVMAS